MFRLHVPDTPDLPSPTASPTAVSAFASMCERLCVFWEATCAGLSGGLSLMTPKA